MNLIVNVCMSYMYVCMYACMCMYVCTCTEVVRSVVNYYLLTHAYCRQLLVELQMVSGAT